MALESIQAAASQGFGLTLLILLLARGGQLVALSPVTQNEAKGSGGV